MPTQEQLLRLIREGKSPSEILEELSLTPSQLRKMLSAKRMQARLALEKAIVAEILEHQAAFRACDVARRLAELTQSGNAETARKACSALLGGEVHAAERDRAGQDINSGSTPWKLLAAEESGGEKSCSPAGRGKQGG